MTPPPFTPEQTVAVALIAAISREDIPTATRIVHNTDNLNALAMHCATIAAYKTDPKMWDYFLALIAHNETEAVFKPVEDDSDDE